MDAAIDLSATRDFNDDELSVRVEFGNLIVDVSIQIGPLDLSLSYEQARRLHVELSPYFTPEPET